MSATGPAPGRMLVTGATGFVGRVLVDAARARGWSVSAAVRAPDARLPAGVRVEPVGDLAGAVDWGRALDGVDVVVHLAARVHVMRETAADALGAFRRVNVDATVALAEACARAGVRRLVYASSVKVLGESTPLGAPFDDASPPAPADPYGVSKLEAERALAGVSAAGGPEIAVLRPPLVHGPGAGGNLERLVRWVAAGVPLPIGSIDNRRSLVGVDNLADALLAAAGHPAAAGRTFLVADGEDLSTPELVRRIGRVIGREARIVPVPTPLLSAAMRVAGRESLRRLLESLQVDARGLRDALGWRPPRTVDQGLARLARRGGAT